jgi:isocitrate lyase
MVNQLAMSRKYTHQKNRVLIPHHRSLALYILAYYNCDLEAIDP